MIIPLTPKQKGEFIMLKSIHLLKYVEKYLRIVI